MITDPSKYPSGIVINNGTDIPLYVSGAFYVGVDYTALVVDVDQVAQITNYGGLSGGHGILLDTAGNVTNNGHVTGLYYGAIDLDAGGAVKNYGTITTTGTGAGIYATAGLGNVYNYGQINASHPGIDLKDGGTVTNTSAGTITSLASPAVNFYGSAILSNAGLISTSASRSAVDLLNGGFVENLAGGTISGASHAAIYILAADGGDATVVNYAGGILTGQGVISGYRGVDVSGGPGSITNAGLIIGLGKPGVDLAGGGVVVNTESGTITTQGTADAVYTNTAPGSVLNAGLITAPKTSYNAVGLHNGGYAMNAVTGTIVSAKRGIFADGFATIVNAGMISTSGASSEIVLEAGGTIINAATGTLAGPTGTGIYLDGSGLEQGMLFNAGSIIGGGGTNDGVHLLVTSFVSNAASGLISGTAFGLHGTGAPDTVTNAGTIIATNTLAGSRPIGLGFGTAATGSYLLNEAGGVIVGAYAITSLGASTTILNESTLLGGIAGIYLSNGGQIINQGDGTIAASGIVPGNPMAIAYGIKVSGGEGTISNLGTIVGRNDGVLMSSGGTLKNQVDGSIGIIIQIATPSYADVKLVGTLASTILNAGTIGAVGPIPVSGNSSGDLSGVNGATGVLASSGVYLTNFNSGLIAGSYGIHSTSGPVAITNFGTILENHNTPITTADEPAISITGTGGILAYVSNAASGVISAYTTGLAFTGVTGTVVNSGTFLGAARFSAGGTLINQSGGIFLHTSITGGFSAHVPTTVVNAGTLAQSSIIVYGTVINQTGGTISDYRYGIYLSTTGSVFNTGTIGQTGTYFNSVSDSNEFAAIRNNPNVAALIPNYGTYAIYINNAANGLIYGAVRGVLDSTGPLTIQNSGTISGGRAGIDLGGGGSVNNTEGGKISSIYGPSPLSNLPSTLVNAGSIQGRLYNISYIINRPGGQLNTILDKTANHSTAQDTIVNAGAIGVLSLNSYANDLLVVDPGALFLGSVYGDNAPGSTHVSTLELAAGRGALAGLGTTITNFASIIFDPGAIWAIEGNAVGLSGQITGLTPGDMIQIEGFAATSKSYLNGALSLTNAANGKISLDLPGDFTTNNFIVTSDGTGAVTDVSLACFAAGTMIETPGGALPVEALRVGDLVLAHDGDAGGELRPQPIVWIGHRSYDCATQANPVLVWPIRVRAGALGAGLPRRDLLLSSQHALFLRGVLIPVGLLVNGHSIARLRVDRITYYHIELPAHAIVLAEGVEAESYLNTDERGTFDPLMSTAARWPDFVAHLWEAVGCARLVLCGVELEAARLLLAQPRTRRRPAGLCRMT